MMALVRPRAALPRIGFRVVMAFATLALSGCASVSTYHDPFDPARAPAAQSVVTPASNGPSLRVELVGGTGAAMKDIAAWTNEVASFMAPASVVDELDPRHFQDELNRILAPKFRSIEYVYLSAPQGGARPDYVLTLEIAVKLGRHTFGENHVDLRGAISGPDGGQRETLTGHGESTVGWPATFQHFAEARQAAFDEFARNLNGSRLLAAYKAPAARPTAAETTTTPASPPGPTGADSAAVAAPTQPKKPEVRGGLYDVEAKISFNVLDQIFFDPATGELALIGHHDDRFKGAGIPYLQYLAALLESPRPEFSLAWTPDSIRRVDALLARELSQQESDAQAARLAAIIDGSGMITHTGALMLPALGIYPIAGNRAPGSLGAEIKSVDGGYVAVTRIVPGSAAEKAGLQVNDYIISIRPDRQALFASELQRQVRFAGAGATIEINYLHAGQQTSTRAILDAAPDPNPWLAVDRYDLLGMMYRGAGDPRAAGVVESLGVATAMTNHKEQTAFFGAYTGLMRSLDMEADWVHLAQVGATGPAPYNDAYNFGLKLSQHMDSIFHLAGNPLQNYFVSAVNQSHQPGSAISQVLDEFGRQLTPKVGELIDRLIFRPGVGFQIPPELVEDEYHIHPEMVPQYLGVPRDSQLARLMLAGDYLGKQLSNRQDLKRKIPAYQTQIEYQITHPDPNRRSNSAYRVWITVAGVDAAQSQDGKTLAVREARMRFNIRETDDQQNDLPNQPAGGYEDVLTGLYGQLEQEFFTLHELREAAKLAAVAVWMEKQNPGIRLPAEGRASWQGPEKVNGLVYIYLTVNLQHQSRIIKIAEGGVSLVPFPWNQPFEFRVDTSVSDVRGSPTMADVFTRPETATVRTKPADAGAGASPYVASWVAPITGGPSGPGPQAVVLQGEMPNPKFAQQEPKAAICQHLKAQAEDLAAAARRADLASDIYDFYDNNDDPLRPRKAPPGYTRLSNDIEDSKLFPGVSEVDLKKKLAPAGLDYRVALYRDDKSGTIVVAFRGSQSWQDYTAANGPNALQLRSEYYRKARALGRELRQWAYEHNQKLEFVGHSLGGGLATAAALEAGAKATVFNAAAYRSDAFESAGIDDAYAKSLVTNYVVPGELVTNAQRIFDLGLAPGNMVTLSESPGLPTGVGERHRIRTVRLTIQRELDLLKKNRDDTGCAP